MRILFSIAIFFFTTFNVVGQSYDLPSKPEDGKCYEQNFNYDKKLTWEEVSCDILAQKRKHKPTKAEILKTKKAESKLRKYQEKLLALGYDVTVNGVLDANTADAHHKYLKKKEKAKRNKRD
jgi:hypothetical protein